MVAAGDSGSDVQFHTKQQHIGVHGELLARALSLTNFITQFSFTSGNSYASDWLAGVGQKLALCVSEKRRGHMYTNQAHLISNYNAITEHLGEMYDRNCCGNFKIQRLTSSLSSAQGNVHITIAFVRMAQIPHPFNHSSID